MHGLVVSVDQRRDAVVVAARGDVDDVTAMLRLLGVAIAGAGQRPTVVDISRLYVHRRDGVQALCWLLAQRSGGTRTVVLARTSLRSRLRGVFNLDVAWYPAELSTAWIGMAASLAHRRRHLPVEIRNSPLEDPLGELLWTAARECSRPAVAA